MFEFDSRSGVVNYQTTPFCIVFLAVSQAANSFLRYVMLPILRSKQILNMRPGLIMKNENDFRQKQLKYITIICLKGNRIMNEKIIERFAWHARIKPGTEMEYRRRHDVI